MQMGPDGVEVGTPDDVLELLWDYLKKDTSQRIGHKSRVQTGWGTKTKDGIALAPRLIGETGHFTTKTGIVIQHPAAYGRRGWSSMVYRPSTRRIQVGEVWLKTCCRHLPSIRLPLGRQYEDIVEEMGPSEAIRASASWFKDFAE